MRGRKEGRKERRKRRKKERKERKERKKEKKKKRKKKARKKERNKQTKKRKKKARQKERKMKKEVDFSSYQYFSNITIEVQTHDTSLIHSSRTEPHQSSSADSGSGLLARLACRQSTPVFYS